jgi:hypothetical protein
MEKPTIDALAHHLERLERANRRWKCVAGITALGLTLSLALGGFLGTRAVVAQQLEKPDNPAPRRMEYKVTERMYLHQMEKPLRDMAAEGWELVQVVPTEYRTFNQGSWGRFDEGIAVLRRPTVLGK